jgi:hypothetical protein
VDVGGAIAEPTVDNDFFYLCPECDYDLGEDFSNMTDNSCPECDHPIEKSSLTRGSAPVMQLRGFNNDDDEDELPDIEDEGEEIWVEQALQGDIPYSSFSLPYGYQWSDVSTWNVNRDTIYITFESGIDWSYNLYDQGAVYEGSGYYRVYDMDNEQLGDH